MHHLKLHRQVTVLSMDKYKGYARGELLKVLDVCIDKRFMYADGKMSDMTLVDLWRESGFDYSAEEASTIRQIRVMLWIGSNNTKILTYPADKVWRVLAFHPASVHIPLSQHSGTKCTYDPWIDPMVISPRFCFFLNLKKILNY